VLYNDNALHTDYLLTCWLACLLAYLLT